MIASEHAYSPSLSLVQRMLCALFGHAMENERGSAARSCGCGEDVLTRDGETRVRHNLGCFFSGHRYRPAGTRDGLHEYACERCGHPLVYRADDDPYEGSNRFHKNVRYLCGLFGHRTQRVGARRGMTEYACHCGHAFLRADRNLAKVTHPLICVFAGHFVRFTERRNGYAEYLCRNCGHTFYLW